MATTVGAKLSMPENTVHLEMPKIFREMQQPSHLLLVLYPTTTAGTNARQEQDSRVIAEAMRTEGLRISPDRRIADPPVVCSEHGGHGD
jgi:hypothetical protein